MAAGSVSNAISDLRIERIERIDGLNAGFYSDQYSLAQMCEKRFIRDLLDEIEAIDPFWRERFYLLFSSSSENSLRELNLDLSNVFVLMLSDESGTYPAWTAGNAKAVFKCYLNDSTKAKNVFDLPLGCVHDVPFPVGQLNISERPFSVFFSGNLNENRKWLHWHLHKVMGYVPSIMPGRARHFFDLSLRLGERRNALINFTDGFRQGLDPRAYGHLLGLTQVALCPKGFQSAETFRHFEAARAGCVVLSEPLPLKPLYQDAPFLFFHDAKTLSKVLEAIFAEEIDLLALQTQTLNWWNEKAAPRAVARQIIAADRLLTS